MTSNLPCCALFCLILGVLAHFACAFDPRSVIPTHCEDLQPRLEIRDLAQDRDQWEVFLLGLKHMQEANASDPTSYHAIASKLANSNREVDA